MKGSGYCALRHQQKPYSGNDQLGSWMAEVRMFKLTVAQTNQDHYQLLIERKATSLMSPSRSGVINILRP